MPGPVPGHTPAQRPRVSIDAGRLWAGGAATAVVAALVAVVGEAIAGNQAPLPPPLAAKLGRREGLRIAQVIIGSPAEAAGLRAGDVVVAVAGEPIPSTTVLQRRMMEDAIGRRVEITVWRNGALVDVIAVPRELDARNR